MKNFYTDTKLEVISRTGLPDLPIDPLDASTYELVEQATLTKMFSKYFNDVEKPINEEEFIKGFKEKYINEFMILHHNIVVKHKHFNWND